MLDLTIDSQGLEHAVARAKQRGVVLPTFAQMADPTKVPGVVRRRVWRRKLPRVFAGVDGDGWAYYYLCVTVTKGP